MCKNKKNPSHLNNPTKPDHLRATLCNTRKIDNSCEFRPIPLNIFILLEKRLRAKPLAETNTFNY